MSKVDLEKFARAIKRGDSATVEFLINSGKVNINARLPRHANPPALVFAARQLVHSPGILDVFKILVNRHDVDFEARDSEGTSWSHIILSNGIPAALRLVIDTGLDINKHNLLHVSHDYTCTVLLLAAGADVHKRSVGCQTALILLSRWNRKYVVHALIAGGADLDASDFIGMTPRQTMGWFDLEIDCGLVEKAKRDIAKTRLDFVRHRALQVCIGLQSLTIPALQLCEVLLFSCGPVAPLISFHQWWNIATTVKHFKND
jgi:hypothetical protein